MNDEIIDKYGGASVMMPNALPMRKMVVRFIGDVLWRFRYALQGSHIAFEMLTDTADQFDQKFLLRTFAYELTLALRQLLRKGGVVIDAGAQKGYITLHAAKLVGGKGKVVAFEPDFRSRNILFENCKLNRASNVTICPAALGDSPSVRKIKLSSQLGWSSFYPNQRNQHTTLSEEAVSVARMDEVLATELSDCQFNRLTFVKIDCEGAEPEVLRGMQNIFLQASPLIWIEINTGSLAAANSSEAALLKHLWRLGYNTYWPKVGSNRFGTPNLVATPYQGDFENTSHRVFDVLAAMDVHLEWLELCGIHIVEQ